MEELLANEPESAGFDHAFVREALAAIEAEEFMMMLR
jgi:hypothetical protein